ncbi:MAG: DUF4920 domain-containing protein [Cyclobacteriaceae bacterium]|nr:DUF4920 domain-containing protein [Cyclobacteriaceae bacterium]
MKRYFIISLIAFFPLLALAQTELPATGNYGETITKKKAVATNAIPAKLKSTETLDMKAKGTIVEVCQNKGCWMTLAMGDGQTLRVTFKDYGFFVPKDAAGKTAWIEGSAKKDTMSVAQLKHSAEDAGKSEAEINAITEPEEGITFIAKGVIIE